MRNTAIEWDTIERFVLHCLAMYSLKVPLNSPTQPSSSTLLSLVISFIIGPNRAFKLPKKNYEDELAKSDFATFTR
jgi:hypothetical protein